MYLVHNAHNTPVGKKSPNQHPMVTMTIVSRKGMSVSYKVFVKNDKYRVGESILKHNLAVQYR